MQIFNGGIVTIYASKQIHPKRHVEIEDDKEAKTLLCKYSFLTRVKTASEREKELEKELEEVKKQLEKKKKVGRPKK